MKFWKKYSDLDLWNLIKKHKNLKRQLFIFAKLAAIEFTKWKKTGKIIYLEKWNDAEGVYFNVKLKYLVNWNLISNLKKKKKYKSFLEIALM